VKCIGPEAMTASDRLDELAELLARGAQRFFAAEYKSSSGTKNSQVRLAAVGDDEAPCGSRVLNPKSRKPTA
jgi:hypothetical protein